MGIRFLHTADWQIGMKATHVAGAANKVRAARLETAERIVKTAKEREVDFLLIAGDLFEDNAVGNDVVHRILHILEQAAPVSVYILPGNHDVLNPGSVYERPAFQQPPHNVRVLRTSEPILVCGGEVALLPSPVTQKRSETDPTSRFSKQDATYRVGVAHGSPRIEGMYKSDDHPIGLDAPERHRLDYLAVGHWHSWLQVSERMIMPGTPEPSRFGEDSGFVALVALDEPGGLPQVEKIPVRTLEWAEQAFRAEMGVDDLGHQFQTWINGFKGPDKTLVRARFAGSMTTEVEALIGELEDWARARVLYAELDTRETIPSVSEGRLQEIAVAHPFVAGLLADLSLLSVMAQPDAPGLREAAAARERLTGDATEVPAEGPSAGNRKAPSEDRAVAAPLNSDELRKILEKEGLDLDPDLLKEALRQVGYRAGEVWR